MFKYRYFVVILCLLLLALPAFAQDYTVGLSSSDALGQFLVESHGMTLYMFNNDPLDKSVCNDQCAERWPPLLVDSADQLTTEPAIPGDFGTTTRDDGTLEVTYNGMPLYYWQKDNAPGDTTGNRVGNVWWVVPPATVYAFRHGDLPAFLVGPTGMTLYMFKNDTDGTSTCYDQCATNWPPLTVDSADSIVPGLNLWGELGTTARTDGTLQVTYNGMPLYYFAQDAARGDMTGEGKGDVWYTIPAESVAVSHNDTLGDFLVAYNGMTLYTFKNDTAGVSNCADACADNWPPFTVKENDTVVGDPHVMGELATITRADGKLQVTYNGMPLYFFKNDAAPGDTTGQGAGDVWYVAAP